MKNFPIKIAIFFCPMGETISCGSAGHLSKKEALAVSKFEHSNDSHSDVPLWTFRMFWRVVFKVFKLRQNGYRVCASHKGTFFHTSKVSQRGTNS